MSRISHANLVRLVGVAVNHMPWLVVLEFMRYGDLRNLVVSSSACHPHYTVTSSTRLDCLRGKEHPPVSGRAAAFHAVHLCWHVVLGQQGTSQRYSHACLPACSDPRTLRSAWCTWIWPAVT